MTTAPPSRVRAFALACAVVFLAGHVTFLARSLEDLDSVNFALGVRGFSVADHRPHPPGYPVFIALGKVGTAVASRLGAAAGAFDGQASAGLAIWGALLGALMAWPLVHLFWRLAREPRVAAGATALTLACPLVWFSASRPMSDVPGLAVAVMAQAWLVASLMDRGAPPHALTLGALASGFAIGLRSQAGWLTLPLLAAAAGQRAVRGEWRPVVTAALAAAGGVLVWLVPMLAVSGGPGAYLTALTAQAGEDIEGVDMVATNLSPRRLVLGFLHTFVHPWASPGLAAVVLGLAGVGGLAMLVRARAGLLVLALVTGPYLVFHVFVHEDVTTRYDLPLVPAVALLAVRGLAVAGPLATTAGAVALAVASLAITVPAQVAYARQGSPLARALADLDQAGGRRAAPIGMHEAVALAVRGEPVARGALPAPRVHEWLSLVEAWRAGEDRPVWFLADPGRLDLALIDPAARRLRGMYRWPFDPAVLVGGARPSDVDWYELSPPGWVLDRGWGLNPQVAGVSTRDGRGPSKGPIVAWVRPRTEAAVLLVGGRHMGRAGDPGVRFRLAIDGRPLRDWTAGPGFFLHLWTLPAGTLTGAGPLVALTIVSEAADGSGGEVRTAIEQFDLQPTDVAVFGFERGWHEAEYSAAFGRPWRWASGRARLLIHDVGADLVVTVRGESPLRYFDGAPRITLEAGGHVLGEAAPADDFTFRARVPAAVLREGGGVVDLATTRTFVPGDAGGSADRRRLGLRVFDLSVTREPVPAR